MPRPAADDFIAGAVLGMLRAEPANRVAAKEPRALPGPWSPKLSQRERVTAAALPLFRERGFDGVSLSEIGASSGVGATNIGRYIGSEQILVEAYERVSAETEVHLRQAIAGAASAADALEAMARAFCAIAFDQSDLVVVVAQNRSALPEQERPHLRRSDRRLGDLWRSVVADVRPDLSRIQVATVVQALQSVMTMYPQQYRDAPLPDPDLVVRLVVAYVYGAPGRPR